MVDGLTPIALAMAFFGLQVTKAMNTINFVSTQKSIMAAHCGSVMRKDLKLLELKKRLIPD